MRSSWSLWAKKQMLRVQASPCPHKLVRYLQHPATASAGKVEDSGKLQQSKTLD
jgi:hypothetical protein